MIDIADQLLASKSGVTRLVDRLEASGMISREVPADNRRVIYGRIRSIVLSARAISDEAGEPGDGVRPMALIAESRPRESKSHWRIFASAKSML
jgi:hypothetical protein